MQKTTDTAVARMLVRAVRNRTMSHDALTDILEVLTEINRAHYDYAEITDRPTSKVDADLAMRLHEEILKAGQRKSL